MSKRLTKKDVNLFGATRDRYIDIYEILRRLYPAPVAASGKEPPPDPLVGLETLLADDTPSDPISYDTTVSKTLEAAIANLDPAHAAASSSATDPARILLDLTTALRNRKSAPKKSSKSTSQSPSKMSRSPSGSRSSSSSSSSSTSSDGYPPASSSHSHKKKQKKSKRKSPSAFTNKDFRHYHKEVLSAMQTSRFSSQRDFHEMAALKHIGHAFENLKKDGRRHIWKRLQLFHLVARHGWGLATRMQSEDQSEYAPQIDAATYAAAQTALASSTRRMATQQPTRGQSYNQPGRGRQRYSGPPRQPNPQQPPQ